MTCNVAAVLVLAVSVYAAGDDTTGPLTASQVPELASGVEETSLPVHRDSVDKEVEKDVKAGRHRDATAGDMASLATAGDEGKEVGSDWGEPKKLDDDKNDSDSDSDDDDSGSDSDSNSDSGSDSNSDDEEDHNSMKGSKKHPSPWRKGASGGQHDDKQPKMVIKM